MHAGCGSSQSGVLPDQRGDLIRDDAGTWYVLEDNLRTPSGVSYD